MNMMKPTKSYVEKRKENDVVLARLDEAHHGAAHLMDELANHHPNEKATMESTWKEFQSLTEAAASFGADSSEGLASKLRILNRASLGIEPPCERQLDDSQVSRLARLAFEDMLLLYEREEPLDHTGLHHSRANAGARSRDR